MKQEQLSCKKCGIRIGEHNKYLHDGMCDECFFREHFPKEDYRADRRRYLSRQRKKPRGVQKSLEGFNC